METLRTIFLTTNPIDDQAVCTQLGTVIQLDELPDHYPELLCILSSLRRFEAQRQYEKDVLTALRRQIDNALQQAEDDLWTLDEMHETVRVKAIQVKRAIDDAETIWDERTLP
jgi:hypothetical protein